jgi:hypothetical protein
VNNTQILTQHFQHLERLHQPERNASLEQLSEWLVSQRWFLQASWFQITCSYQRIAASNNSFKFEDNDLDKEVVFSSSDLEAQPAQQTTESKFFSFSTSNPVGTPLIIKKNCVQIGNKRKIIREL